MIMDDDKITNEIPQTQKIPMFNSRPEQWNERVVIFAVHITFAFIVVVTMVVLTVQFLISSGLMWRAFH
jgi:hypothetical protein